MGDTKRAEVKKGEREIKRGRETVRTVCEPVSLRGVRRLEER